MNKRLCLGVIAMVTLGVAITTLMANFSTQFAGAIRNPSQFRTGAPTAISGDNIYVAWWTNKTANHEVMFRASIDAGKTFSDKINLSNTTDADSVNVEISANGKNVAVSWWELNQTADVPVMKVSNDNGKTFGPLLKLASNGTIGNPEE